MSLKLVQGCMQSLSQPRSHLFYELGNGALPLRLNPMGAGMARGAKGQIPFCSPSCLITAVQYATCITTPRGHGCTHRNSNPDVFDIQTTSFPLLPGSSSRPSSFRILLHRLCLFSLPGLLPFPSPPLLASPSQLIHAVKSLHLGTPRIGNHYS